MRRAPRASKLRVPQHVSADEMQQVLPEAYSVIMLPKVGSGDPMNAVQDAINLKLKGN